MECYINELFSHMRSMDDLRTVYEHENNIGSVILDLFKKESGVQVLMSFQEDDYSGYAIAVYAYNGKYFHISRFFGSDYCDDDWCDYEYDAIKRDIQQNIVDNIHEVTEPLEDYIHRDAGAMWTKVLHDHSNDAYDKCWNLSQERMKKRAEERERMKSEYDRKCEQELAERRQREREEVLQRRIKKDTDLITDMRNVLSYLECNDATTDPYYANKYPSYIKTLQYCLRNIDGVLGQFQHEITDLKARANTQLRGPPSSCAA